jgi:hypothetical protein
MVPDTCLHFHFSSDFLPRQHSLFGHETLPSGATLIHTYAVLPCAARACPSTARDTVARAVLPPARKTAARRGQ